MDTQKRLSRRDFLKLAGLTTTGAAFSRITKLWENNPLLPPQSVKIVRVTARQLPVYKEPDFESEMVTYCHRDELVYVYKEVVSPYGPVHNPRWYQLDSGYAHTAYLQVVETHTQEVAYHLPNERQLAEVTVPITLSFLFHKYDGFSPLYRLYYQSMHWVSEVGYGPNGQPAYGIRDDLLPITYFVPAHHMRLIPDEEITPLSPEVPPERKKLLVNRTRQTTTAFEDGQEVFHTDVSTGEPYDKPGATGPSTITPLGNYYISLKMPVRHMGDGQVTADIFAYELPGVPWVSYFYKTGVAFHGCYWHDNYGQEMSHGCVNMRPDEAKWVFRWAAPESPPNDRVVQGYGTQVEVVV
ncbi:MAG: L,D-transpeptidase [Anaerolineales bacterium]|nr:L,D-transpeptidase [Anaerolineales bacterium]